MTINYHFHKPVTIIEIPKKRKCNTALIKIHGKYCYYTISK